MFKRKGGGGSKAFWTMLKKLHFSLMTASLKRKETISYEATQAIHRIWDANIFMRMSFNLDLGFFARPVSTVKGWIVVSLTWKVTFIVENLKPIIPDNKYWKVWNHVPLNQGCLPSAQDRGPPSCPSEQTRELSLSISFKKKFVERGATWQNTFDAQ